MITQGYNSNEEIILLLTIIVTTRVTRRLITISVFF